MDLVEDLRFRLFHKWMPIRHLSGPPGKQYWECQCSCGLIKSVQSYDLTSGRSKRCRKCSAGIVGVTVHKTHGMGSQKNKAYRAWTAMKTRCYNPDHKVYRYHGALGVTVSPLWIDNFAAFHAYIGEPPTLEHTVDRIDPWGHYEPGNVRWATWAEQAMNKRKTASYNGQKPRPE